MAGLGFKTFTAGEVLTAANVNGYLMEQAVMTFAGTAARGSAISSPSEGMLSYLSDSNTFEYYDGSAWTALIGGVTFTSSTATAYTVQSSDASSILRFTAASAVAVTISTATAFTAGQSVDILMDGAGTVTVSPGVDVTLNGRGTAGTAYAIAQQYDAVSVLCVASDSYRIIGNAEAV